MELRFKMRGFSAVWNKTRDQRPITVPRVGIFRGNTAHSNAFCGVPTTPTATTPDQQQGSLG